MRKIEQQTNEHMPWVFENIFNPIRSIFYQNYSCVNIKDLYTAYVHCTTII